MSLRGDDGNGGGSGTLRVLSLNCCLAAPGLNLRYGPVCAAFTILAMNLALGRPVYQCASWLLASGGSVWAAAASSVMVAATVLLAITWLAAPTLAVLLSSLLQVSGSEVHPGCLRTHSGC